MSFHSIALFLHIVGALGMFAAFGIEWASLVYVQRTSTAEQALEWLGLRGWIMRLGPASLVVILLSGLYMMAPAWKWVGWIVVALASIVLIAVPGATLTGLRIGPIEKAVARARGQVSPALRQRLGDPLLWTSLTTRTAIALGIVFLMVTRPDLVGSMTTIGIAILLGLASSLPVWRNARIKREEAVSGS